MRKNAIIVAGGAGTRMGGDLPKQFMLLNDRPVIYYAIKTFLDAYDDLSIVLVLPEAHLDSGRKIIKTHFDKKGIRTVAGGETRFHSVKNGLTLVEDESIIFVHDGVRCLVTTELIQRCYDMALATGSAVPVVPAKDSVRLLNQDHSEPFDREKVLLVQTPQTFHSKILLPAYHIDYKDRFTDEATVVEAYGMRVSLVEGDEDNIKITKPLDLLIAEKILDERNFPTRA